MVSSGEGESTVSQLLYDTIPWRRKWIQYKEWLQKELLQYSCLENPKDRGDWWGYSPRGCKESNTEHTHRYDTINGAGGEPRQWQETVSFLRCIRCCNPRKCVQWRGAGVEEHPLQGGGINSRFAKAVKGKKTPMYPQVHRYMVDTENSQHFPAHNALRRKPECS